ncbi:MAG: hypothetical protein WCX95_00630 [Candidatus Gracilibacteria bacterium]
MLKKLLSLVIVALATTVFSVTVASATTTLKAPTLWSPGAKAVLTNYPRTTSLSWAYVPGATSYEIELACDTCVSSTNLYSSPTTYTTSLNYYVTSALAGDNTFRFKVRAKNASTIGKWSKYRYFSFKTSSNQVKPSSTLGTPTILAPTSDQVLTDYPRTADLDWSTVTGANLYEVEIGCDTCVSSTTLYSSPETYFTSYSDYTTSALAGDNTFRFRVRAKNTATNSTTIGAWSSYRYFRYDTSSYKPSSTLGTPTISNPTSDQVLTDYPRTADLYWSYVTGATSYEIEMGCDTCVSSTTLYSSPTTYTSYYNYYTTPALAGDNTFRFRVRAKNSSTTGSWSRYRYFRYDTSSSASLGIPTISNPTSDQVLTDYPRTADLYWSYVTGATSYEIEMGCDTCVSSTTLYSSPATYTSYYNYYTTPALAGDNTFRFRVRAKNSSTTGSWSRYRYFRYDTSSY